MNGREKTDAELGAEELTAARRTTEVAYELGITPGLMARIMRIERQLDRIEVMLEQLLPSTCREMSSRAASPTSPG
jgi:hypothetical protein